MQGKTAGEMAKIVRLMHLAHLAEICSAKNLYKLQCEDKLQSERINPGKGNDPSWCVLLHFHLSSTYLRFSGREYCIRFEQIWFWCRKKVEIDYFKANIFNLDKKIDLRKLALFVVDTIRNTLNGSIILKVTHVFLGSLVMQHKSGRCCCYAKRSFLAVFCWNRQILKYCFRSTTCSGGCWISNCKITQLEVRVKRHMEATIQFPWQLNT